MVSRVRETYALYSKETPTCCDDSSPRIPNLSGVFRRNQSVGVYLQIYNAAIDQTTLRPAADAEYVLLKNGKELSKQTERCRPTSDVIAPDRQ